jgi:guanylate kinase
MFAHKVRAGHFVEHESVFHNHYGTPKKSIRDLQQTGKNVLLCIDVKGAKSVCRKFPKAVTIFIKTHSLDDLKKRLQQRGSENGKIIEERLDRARLELARAKNYQYVIINDNLNKAFIKLKNIIAEEASQ